MLAKKSSNTLSVPSKRESNSKSLPKKDKEGKSKPSQGNTSNISKSSRRNSKGSLLKPNGSKSEADFSQKIHRESKNDLDTASRLMGTSRSALGDRDGTPKSASFRKNRESDKSPKNVNISSISGVSKSKLDISSSFSKRKKSEMSLDGEKLQLSSRDRVISQQSAGRKTPRSTSNLSKNKKNKSIISNKSHQNTDVNLNVSSSSDSNNDDDFDVILSPRALKRLHEQNQIAHDATNLDRESELMLSAKIDDWKRDRLEKEFKCLFYKTREISQLLLDQQSKANEYIQQTEVSNETCNILKSKYKQCKKMLKEAKTSLASQENNQASASKKEQHLLDEVDQMNRTIKEQKNQLKGLEFELGKSKNEQSSEKNGFVEKMKELKAKLNEQQTDEVKKTQTLEKLEAATRKKIEKLELQSEQLEKQLNLERDKHKYEIEQLRKLMNDHENKYLIEQKQSQQKENNQYDILQQLEKERDKLANQIESLLETNNKCTMEITEMQRSLKDEKDEYWRMKEECQVLQLKNQNVQQQLEEQKKKNENQKKKISEVEEQLYKLKAEKYEETTHLEINNQQQLQLENQLQQFKKELESEKKTRFNAEEDRNKFREMSSILERENKILKEESSQRLLEQDRGREQNQRVEEQLRRDLEEAKALSRENEGKLKRKESKMNRLRDEMESKIKKLQEKNLSLENELILQSRNAEDKAQSLVEMQRNFDRQQIQNKIAEDEKKRIDSLMKQVEIDNKNKYEQENLLKQRIQYLETQLNDLDQEKEQYKSKLQFTKYESKKIKDDFNQKENKMKSAYENQIEQFQTERDQLLQTQIKQQNQIKQKESKIKVISDIKDLVKCHKEKIKELDRK